MLELQGIPVSPGVAIGPALVLDDEGYRIPRCLIPAADISVEWGRLLSAFGKVAKQLEVNRKQTAERLGEEAGRIFSAQQQMLSDPGLLAELEGRVHQQQQSAAYAVSRVLHRYAEALGKLNSPFLAERAEDVLDIEKQLLHRLGAVTSDPLSNLDEPVILLARNLTPSETANLDRHYVRGFCTEIGGPGGHTAIVAKGLELPAVVGIGQFLDRIGQGSQVIVDGDRGCMIVDPDQATIDRYEERAQIRQKLTLRLAELRDLPAETVDGQRVTLSANIEFPHEVDACLQRGADGIGLYRTEFLYLSSDEEPSEEDHYQAYTEVVGAMQGRPVVIRTLDLGADKMGHTSLHEPENNPFLGLRSIRLSLKNQDLFRTQIRAVLRAAVHGDVRMMFPLISTLQELRTARMLVNIVIDDLREEGADFRSDIPIGMMVEVPAAVIMIDRFAEEVDFFSIGTNDLVQYTLAVDRSNESVAELYQSSDPAVLRLIKQTVDVSNKTNTPVGICGEMSSNPARVLLLLGLGVRSVSVPPLAIPRIKKVIRSVTIADCEEIACRVMQLESAREVDLYLLDRLGDLVPELVVQ
ncbi:Phosphoenolpyruvate-protein phosphotransferase [Rosistilla carotiformis]|uniref:Phosphoenolpyruvate-protein phosphotransferase n=1 Tax=Rosistilla carotiformis TaxID=2528017 RepID=A0A518JQ43_9BACT|nr:phosphoenolpyruvate--protein phosphotransferase [Rosistilla carotiformis]QDV67662.1 Phosphoenolpyruvate-protein phosphotransferase [Rosistilla carotiformis]